MWKYSWFKAGLLEERPPEFLNPVDFSFGKRSGLGICSCCDQPEFIMCSHCEQLLCFHHFWHGPNGLGHWCVMEHVHWIGLNLFICFLILFCSAKSSKTILGFLMDIQMGNFNLRAKTKFSCSTIKIKIVEKWHLKNLLFNLLC